MRAVLVHEDSVLVVMVVCIAADVIPPVADQHAFVEFPSQLFRTDTTGVPRPNNQVVEHCLYPFPRSITQYGALQPGAHGNVAARELFSGEPVLNK